MEVSGSKKSSSSSSSSNLPTSSTFRRLPIGRSAFRRDRSDAGDTPTPDKKASTNKLEQVSPTHQRAPTYPSLAADSLSTRNDDVLKSSFPSLQFLSNRTSSLPSSPRQLTDPSASSYSNLPQPPSSAGPLAPTQRDNMTAMQTLTSSIPVDADELAPITYPSHLAQTKPDVVSQTSGSGSGATIKGERQREYTMGTGPILSAPILDPTSPTKAEGSSRSRRKDSMSNGDGTGRPPIRPIPRSALEDGSSSSSTPSHVNRKASTDITAATAGSHQDDGAVDSSRRRPSIAPPSAASTLASAQMAPSDTSTVRARSDHRKPNSKSTRSTNASAIITPKLPSAPTNRAPISAMYFSSLPIHGRPPDQGLRAHTGTLVGDKIWLIGGVDAKNCWRGVASFDTETMFWSTMETFGETLPPIRAHTTTLVGTDLYIFGGGDGPTYSNDVWIFDTVTHRFSRPKITSTTNKLPPPRRAHTSILYKNFLVVYGGGNGSAALNDIWALDVADPANLAWREWATTGDKPQKKGYHTANLVGNKMVVFGGSDGHASFADVHILNLDTLKWTLVTTDIKHNRLSHTSTQVGSYLFVIGGHNGQNYAQDVLLFNLITLQWETKIPAGVAPPGRGYHVSLLHDGRIFISGGYNGMTVFDDLWALELSASAYLPQVTTFDIDEGDASRPG